MTIGKKKAREKARDLLLETGTERIPVPVDKVAKKRGIKIQYAPLNEGLSGMAFIKDGLPTIGVNALHHPNRQRFTIAHELGHHILHSHILSETVHVDKIILNRDRLAAKGTDVIEIEANAFASELLMPETSIQEIVGTGFDMADEQKLFQLAKKFKVSLAALQYRLLY